MLKTFWIVMSSVEKTLFRERRLKDWNAKIQWTFFFNFLKLSMKLNIFFYFLKPYYPWKKFAKIINFSDRTRYVIP